MNAPAHKRWTHFMIDDENLSVEPNGAVLTIGVRAFDIKTGEKGPAFYERMDRELALKYGIASASTLEWWESQNPAQREEAYEGYQDPVEVAAALREWFAAHSHGGSMVWANGSCMDIVQLEWWFRQTNPVVGKWGHEYPWKYWNVMDQRTIMFLANLRMPKDRPAHVRHHHALDDADFQVEWVVKAYNKLLGAPPVTVAPVGLPPMNFDDPPLNVECD